MQTGAVYLQNVTFNDTGTYRCTFRRTLLLSLSHQLVIVEKEVELTVVAEGEAGCCSFSASGFVSISFYRGVFPQMLLPGKSTSHRELLHSQAD